MTERFCKPRIHCSIRSDRDKVQRVTHKARYLVYCANAFEILLLLTTAIVLHCYLMFWTQTTIIFLGFGVAEHSQLHFRFSSVTTLSAAGWCPCMWYLDCNQWTEETIDCFTAEGQRDIMTHVVVFSANFIFSPKVYFGRWTFACLGRWSRDELKHQNPPTPRPTSLIWKQMFSKHTCSYALLAFYRGPRCHCS